MAQYFWQFDIFADVLIITRDRITKYVLPLDKVERLVHNDIGIHYCLTVNGKHLYFETETPRNEVSRLITNWLIDRKYQDLNYKKCIRFVQKEDVL